MANLDPQVVDGFGDEWTRFDQSALDDGERQRLFDTYFTIFPFDRLPEDAVGADIGCGSGRWALLVAEKVGTLYCVDASEGALNVARRNLAGTNCRFVLAGVETMELPPLDFGYSLGVLHHIPDTLAGLRSCVDKLKPGAPFLLYLYYDFENRPAWFWAIWKASDLIRRVISKLPMGLRNFTTDAIAVLIYWPMARLGKLGMRVGIKNWPLGFYSDKSFYVMATDSRDRFGTQLEQRFSRKEITRMMQAAGLEGIVFSDTEPHWVAVGTKVHGPA